MKLFRNFFRFFSSTASDAMVRFIDAEGKNHGIVPKDSIIIPTGHNLTQVAPNVFKLIPLPTEKETPPITNIITNSKPSIVKTIQLRPAIAPQDLERMLDRVRGWLDTGDHKRVSAVNILIKREGGAKARARGITADALLEQVIKNLEPDGFKPASIKKEGMELSCIINKSSSK